MATGTDSFTFLMSPYFAVNHTVAEFNALMKPWYDQLEKLGITYTPDSTYYDDFYDAWQAGFPLETVASSTMMTGSWLFPRANWENATLLNTTFETIKSTIETRYPMLAYNLKAKLPGQLCEPGLPQHPHARHHLDQLGQQCHQR
jgi:hypothetical protein